MKACTHLASWGIAILILLLLTPRPSHAEDPVLLSVGLRSGTSVGTPTPTRDELEDFYEEDVIAVFRLPWEWHFGSGWGIRTRLQVSCGALIAAGNTGFVGTFVPGISIGKKEGRISLDIGGGGALLSEYRFGRQDLGGPFQFVWDTAVRIKVCRGFRVGYCFHHMSDAAIYGMQANPAHASINSHMLDLSYWF
jgi:hypothetical protein